MIQTDPGSRTLGSDPGIRFRDPRTCLIINIHIQRNSDIDYWHYLCRVESKKTPDSSTPSCWPTKAHHQPTPTLCYSRSASHLAICFPSTAALLLSMRMCRYSVTSTVRPEPGSVNTPLGRGQRTRPVSRMACSEAHSPDSRDSGCRNTSDRLQVT